MREATFMLPGIGTGMWVCEVVGLCVAVSDGYRRSMPASRLFVNTSDVFVFVSTRYCFSYLFLYFASELVDNPGAIPV